MFGFTAQERRELTELRARVDALEKECDLGELERMRKSVLTALRALRRAQQAEDEREQGGPVVSTDRRQLTLDPRLLKLRQDIAATRKQG